MTHALAELLPILSQPENELLLRCARVQPNPESIARIKSIVASSPDWTTITRQAGAHKLAPLLYSNLSAHCSSDTPPDIMLELQRHFKTNSQRSTLFGIELNRLSEAFDTRQVPVLSFKGPALAVAAYHNMALRRCDDLDFFVRETDMAKAINVLASLGYERFEPDGTELMTSLRYHVALLHPQTKILVEVHWKLAPPYFYFPLHFEEVWSRTGSVPMLGRPTPIFAPDDLLPCLAVHGAKHNWRVLNWVCDVAELVDESHHIDWHQLLRRAEALHSKRMLLLSLALADQLLGAQLSTEIQDAIRADRYIAILLRQVCAWIFAPPSEQVDFERYAFQIKVRDRLADKVLYIKIKQPMLDPNAASPESLPVPDFDQPLYYALRFIRWLRLWWYRPLRRFLSHAMRG